MELISHVAKVITSEVGLGPNFQIVTAVVSGCKKRCIDFPSRGILLKSTVTGDPRLTKYGSS